MGGSQLNDFTTNSTFFSAQPRGAGGNNNDGLTRACAVNSVAAEAPTNATPAVRPKPRRTAPPTALCLTAG